MAIVTNTTTYSIVNLLSLESLPKLKMFGSPQLGFDCAKIATVPESVGFPKRVDTKFAAREHPAYAGNEDGRWNDAQQAARRDAASLPFVSRLRKRFHQGDRPAAGAAAAR